MILFWGVLISRAGVFILSSCENQIFLTRCWEFCHSNFLKHPVGFLEVLNFWSNENQNFRLCVAVLLDRCQTFFVTGTPLAVVFILSKIKQFVNSFEVFFQPFKIFQVREFLKAARGAAGNKFSGVVPPLFPWNCLGQSPGFGVSCRHLNRLIFGFFNFSFFAHAKDEMRKLTRRVQTRPMRFFFNQRGLVRDRGWLLPLGRSPSVRILDLFVVIQNMTKSTIELKSYGVKV